MAIVTTLDLPGSSLSYGFESELADRALRRALVINATDKETAITAAVTAAQDGGGNNLYGTNNIPLLSATAVRLGVARWLVDLTYGRTRLSTRRDNAIRRATVTTMPDTFTPVYLTTENYLNGLPFDSITTNTPGYSKWYFMPYVSGSNLGQHPQYPPSSYMFRRPQIRISLNYSLRPYNFGDGEIAKIGKTNANNFYISEISNSFGPGELFYLGFNTEPKDIERFVANVTFSYTPGGYYQQNVQWNNGATYPGEKYWYVTQRPMYDTTQF